MNEVQVWAFAVTVQNANGIQFCTVHMSIGRSFEKAFDSAIRDSKKECPEGKGWRGHTVQTKMRMPDNWKQIIVKAIKEEGKE
jgi:hypothetical protein